MNKQIKLCLTKIRSYAGYAIYIIFMIIVVPNSNINYVDYMHSF